MDRTERFYKIDQMIHDRRLVSFDQLMQALEVSRANRVGDGVTPVALSHHRTCGSASGGSLNTLESSHRIEQRHQT